MAYIGCNFLYQSSSNWTLDWNWWLTDESLPKQYCTIYSKYSCDNNCIYLCDWNWCKILSCWPFISYTHYTSTLTIWLSNILTCRLHCTGLCSSNAALWTKICSHQNMKYPMAVHYITAVINKSKADKIWTIRFVLSIRVTDKCKYICLKFQRIFN